MTLVRGPSGGTATTIERGSEIRALKPWRVIVWDDDVNTMDFVVDVFQRLFGYDLERATKLMLEVHLQGRSIVFTGPRERSEYYAEQLGNHGLTASIEQA